MIELSVVSRLRALTDGRTRYRLNRTEETTTVLMILKCWVSTEKSMVWKVTLLNSIALKGILIKVRNTSPGLSSLSMCLLRTVPWFPWKDVVTKQFVAMMLIELIF